MKDLNNYYFKSFLIRYFISVIKVVVDSYLELLEKEIKKFDIRPRGVTKLLHVNYLENTVDLLAALLVSPQNEPSGFFRTTTLFNVIMMTRGETILLNNIMKLAHNL